MVERSDTTGIDGIKTSHPEGVTECGREKRVVPSGIPAGMQGFCWGTSGDVAALNPRLMDLIPPGSGCLALHGDVLRDLILRG